MSKLEPGMLAIIIGARYVGTMANIGKMVEVVSIEPDSQALVKGESITDQYGSKVEQALCLTSHLMPIKPEFDPLETKQEQELHA